MFLSPHTKGHVYQFALVDIIDSPIYGTLVSTNQVHMHKVNKTLLYIMQIRVEKSSIITYHINLGLSESSARISYFPLLTGTVHRWLEYSLQPMLEELFQ